VQQTAERAFARLLERIRQGDKPQAAINAVMKEFNADTLTSFREAFSAVLEASLDVKELRGNYTDQQARELMRQDRIEYVQIRLSSKHPKTDICDYHAKLDRYGLGPGVYPKADAPKPPFHAHCYCLTAPRIDLINPKPKFNPKAERAFLESLPANEARAVAGSFDKLARAKAGESLEAIYNAGKDELYQWKRVGEVGQTARMKKTLSVSEIESMPFDQAHEVVASIVTSKAFKEFVTTNKDGEMPVAVLTDLLQQVLGASVKTVRISRDDRDKQIRKGNQEGRDRYDLLQKMIDEGEVIQYRDQAISLYEYEGEWYQAVIRKTNAGDELYLKPLRRADREQLERDRKRGLMIQKKYGAN